MSTQPREIPNPPFLEKMQRFYGQMEQALYAAECACPDGYCCEHGDCAFMEPDGFKCRLKRLRALLGNHPPLPQYCEPCQPQDHG